MGFDMSVGRKEFVGMTLPAGLLLIVGLLRLLGLATGSQCLLDAGSFLGVSPLPLVFY
jgi:hypothetical protein